jgi:pyruvate formate lyase activating enzyme
VTTPAPPPHAVLGGWQQSLPNGKLRCTLCPRECELADGQRGFCFSRERQGDQIVLGNYGRVSGFCIDPIEKKPLFHFFPGSSVLSFGTAGCNLGCRYCQNWDISKARDAERLGSICSVDAIAETAQNWDCRSVAFTYNDPVVFAEFAIETAKACRARGVKSVAVTAGYIQNPARKAFFEFMDAANVDLKAYTETFYHDLCAGKLEPVKETLRYLTRETEVWTEITTLLIPGYNDSEEDLKRLVDFVLNELGSDVPVHFTAFHGDYRMVDVPSTPKQTCVFARELAKNLGLRHVYVGNVDDDVGQNSYCECGQRLIVRRGYSVRADGLVAGRCRHCGTTLKGRIDPLGLEDFGPRRIPVAVPSHP